ncbi:hypothetical protein EYB25_000370 [Talaromyces marneffei]|nr:hypothetical protein EYB25_000370 [Talaromyces marneffei]
MPCLGKLSRSRFLTPKAGKRRPTWIQRLFRALSKKQKKKYQKRPKISLVRQDSSDLFTIVRPSPLFDPFIDPFDQQSPTTPVSFSPDSFFQIPSRRPSQEYLIACSDSSQQDKNLRLEPSPDPPSTLRVRIQDTASSPQSPWFDDLVRKRPSTPPFPPVFEDQSTSQFHINKGSSAPDSEVFSKRIFPLLEDCYFPTQHYSLLGTDKSEEGSLVSSIGCVAKSIYEKDPLKALTPTLTQPKGSPTERPPSKLLFELLPPKTDSHRLSAYSRKSRAVRSEHAKMEVSRASQFLDPSSAMATLTKQKLESIKLAREQAAAVHEMCRRAKSEVPPYEFEELIGKGAYGRVYKGRQLPSRDLVAIKVMDIDTLDYKMHRDMKDESIKDFIHEIKAMNQAKEAGARNINMLIEAISIHSQLWVVCEYCPGGSVKTLMRATGDKLEEKYIIPIARELASGLRAIHDAGIIHRDVKAGNILIHEEGRLQICDFGVAGILQSKVDKRSTWIGTPHWMPPEMFSTRGGEAHQYGSELDVWAYGCTLYEFATGNPPNAGLRERMQIGRALGRNTPKLEGDQYSQELKNLVAFSLNSDPLTRPTMATILEHPYIAGSETEYPTKSLSELVRNYYQWSQRGGQRMSLFHPGGAAAAEFPDNPQFEEDWNFSTTDGFERRYSVLDLDQLSASLAELAGNEPSFPQNPEPSMDDMTITEMTPIEKANFDERVKRGAAAMEGLFDEHKPTYKYETKSDFVPIEEKEAPSDLPLRTTTDRSSVTSTFIDINLGSFDSAHYAAGTASQFQLADADTIRANRSSLRSGRNSDGEQSRNRYSDVESETDTFQPNAPRPPTMDWKFPTMIVPEDNEPETLPAPVADTEPFISPAEEKRATRDWKFPVMTDTANEEMPILEKDNLYTYDETPAHTIRPAQVQTHQSRSSHQSQQSTLDLSLGHVNNNLSVDGLDVAAISRPSTATSTISDYDPFRFDRSPDNSQRTHHRMASKAPSLFSISSLDEGPGPDHEDDIIVEEDGPGPDHEDIPELTPNATAGTSMTAQMELSQQRQRAASSSSRDLSRPTSQTLQFPEVQFPSAESMMEGASDDVITAELDRLIDDFMQACYSTINVVENME